MSVAADYAARLGGSWCDIQGHLGFIHAEARGRRAMAELGVRTGNSTAALLAATSDGADGQLWSVDTDVPRVPESWHELAYWHFLQADDLSEAARRWVPARLDLLLVDTSHDRDHTLRELSEYASRVLPGGVVLCHDTEWDVGDRQLEAPVGPVARALDSYCAEHGLTWENRPGSYGLGVLRV